MGIKYKSMQKWFDMIPLLMTEGKLYSRTDVQKDFENDIDSIVNDKIMKCAAIARTPAKPVAKYPFAKPMWDRAGKAIAIEIEKLIEG